jgi:hypothetical protein
VPNYGDCALRLAPDWDRNKCEQFDLMMTAVGHVNGKADLHLTKDEDAEHQFYWADPKDQKDVANHRRMHYEWVRKAEWTKNVEFWNWDAEEFCEFGGLRAMARPKSYWLEDEQRRKGLSERVRKDDEEQFDRMAPGGLQISDAEGRPLNKLQRKSRSRVGI